MKRAGLTFVELLILLALAAGLAYAVFAWNKSHSTAHVAARTSDSPVQSDHERQAQQPVRFATYRGNVWIQRASGETLSVASQEVFFIPAGVSMKNSKSDELDEGLSGLRYDVQNGNAHLSGNGLYDQFAVAEGRAAQGALTPFDSQSPNGVVSSVSVLAASMLVVQMKAEDLKFSVSCGLSRDSGLPVMINGVDDEHFWNFAQRQKLASAVTDRDGNFVLEGVPPGVGLICSRLHNTVLGAVVYWAIPVGDKVTGNESIQLSPSNAHVISY